jgi:hypothetical protein
MVTLHSSDRTLLDDLTVTLQRFIPLLNFSSTKKELLGIVVQEKYTADWGWPSAPGTSLFATKLTSHPANFDFIFSISTVGRSVVKMKV